MSSCRESEFRIDREGTWFYRGMEMSRRDIVRQFYQHLLRDGSGRFFVEMGKQRCHVEVEDTAYVVRAIGRGGDSASEKRICLLLSDDSIEELDPATLRIGGSHVPYCRVKANRFDARFCTSSYYQLAELIRHDLVRDRYYIELGKRLYDIPEQQNE